MYFTVLTGSSLVHDDSCRRWLGYDLSENFQIQNDSVFRLWNTGSCFFLRKKLKPKHRTGKRKISTAGDQISIQNRFIVICVIITRNTQKSSCSCINCGTSSVKFCVIKCPERVRLSESTNKRSKKKKHTTTTPIYFPRTIILIETLEEHQHLVFVVIISCSARSIRLHVQPVYNNVLYKGTLMQGSSKCYSRQQQHR